MHPRSNTDTVHLDAFESAARGVPFIGNMPAQIDTNALHTCFIISAVYLGGHCRGHDVEAAAGLSIWDRLVRQASKTEPQCTGSLIRRDTAIPGWERAGSLFPRTSAAGMAVRLLSLKGLLEYDEYDVGDTAMEVRWLWLLAQHARSDITQTRLPCQILRHRFQ